MVRVIIEFTESVPVPNWGSFAKGEQAAFPPDMAARLIAHGVAVDTGRRVEIERQPKEAE